MSDPPPPRIRPLGHDDLAFAAALHRQALPHGFFARLGPRFLARYHATFVDSPHAVALLAEHAPGPSGLVVGPVDAAAHRSWVLDERGPRLALAGLGALAVRPRVLATFLRSRLGRYSRAVWHRLRPGRERGRAASGRPVAVLMHVAVAPHARGTGTGRALVAAFCEQVAARGAREVRLVTLGGPRGAGPFYRHLGWEHVGDHPDRDGRIVSEFRLVLPETAAP